MLFFGYFLIIFYIKGKTSILTDWKIFFWKIPLDFSKSSNQVLGLTRQMIILIIIGSMGPHGPPPGPHGPSDFFANSPRPPSSQKNLGAQGGGHGAPLAPISIIFWFFAYYVIKLYTKHINI